MLLFVCRLLSHPGLGPAMAELSAIISYPTSLGYCASFLLHFDETFNLTLHCNHPDSQESNQYENLKSEDEMW